ncbi:MAG: hypothetical protein AB7E51_15060 [Pseudodesulfovibrio sp.]|uniref:hypothetical protein n=1 Tax=Pseudodesulfovibrio sp. TaxID=2035812 RepID=UPI003D12DBA8
MEHLYEIGIAVSGVIVGASAAANFLKDRIDSPKLRMAAKVINWLALNFKVNTDNLKGK